jgi:hypothetical protein
MKEPADPPRNIFSFAEVTPLSASSSSLVDKRNEGLEYMQSSFRCGGDARCSKLFDAGLPEP